MLSELEDLSDPDFVTVSLRVPKAVVCLPPFPPSLFKKPGSGLTVSLFEGFFIQFEAVIRKAFEKPSHGLAKGLWLYRNQGIEKIKSYGLYLIHNPYT